MPNLETHNKFSPVVIPSGDNQLGWLLPSAFWFPGWKFSASHSDHLRFYFWLVDVVRPRLVVDLVADRPEDYLALCQSIDRLGFGAKCVGLSGMFDSRRFDNGLRELRDYHDIHYGQFSTLEAQSDEIVGSFSPGTIDLLLLDGIKASQMPDSDRQACLDLLSPRGLVLLVNPPKDAKSWGVGSPERAATLVWNRTSSLQIVGAALTRDKRLSSLIDETGDAAAADPMRMVFKRLGSALRDHALQKETASFAESLELSLVEQSAMADLLRQEKAALEADYQHRTAERDQFSARVAALESYVEQFRAEVLRLQEYAVQTKQECDRLTGIVGTRDQEIKALAEGHEDALAKLHRLLASREDDLRSVRLNQTAAGITFGEEKAHLHHLLEKQKETADALADEKARLESFIKQQAFERGQFVAHVASLGPTIDRLRTEDSLEQEENRRAAHRHRLEKMETETALSQERDRHADQIHHLQHHADRLLHELNRIKLSTSWKLTAPLRNVFTHLPATARVLRRGLKLVWWTLSFQLYSRLSLWRAARRRSTIPADASDPDCSIAALDAVPPLGSSVGQTGSEADEIRLPVSEEALPPRTVDRLIGQLTLLVALAQQNKETISATPSETTLGAPDAVAGVTDVDLVGVDPVAPESNELVSIRIASSTPAAIDATDAPIADPNVSLPAVTRTLGRVQEVEQRVIDLASLVEMERQRIDYALLGADGLLNEIELYNHARAQADYKQVFDKASPLVSVCVATMNRSELLIERSLKSLIGQTYPNLQIVVIGDHCTDDTGSRIAALRDDRIVFKNLPSRGPYPAPGIDRWRVAGSNAMNAALAMCEGQFITHLDDDDSATADRIETLLTAAQEHKADFCWHPFMSERGDGTWHMLGDGRFELGQITTSSIFYHNYFKRIPWNVFSYRTQEPGDWNRLRKIRTLRPKSHFVDRSLLFHYCEGNQTPFVRQDGEAFLE